MPACARSLTLTFSLRLADCLPVLRPRATYACRAQSFRELGNAFALLRMIDATVGTQNALESHFAAPFVGGVNAATGGAVKFSTHDTALTAGMHALASGTMGYGAADGAAGAHARATHEMQA